MSDKETKEKQAPNQAQRLMEETFETWEGDALNEATLESYLIEHQDVDPEVARIAFGKIVESRQKKKSD